MSYVGSVECVKFSEADRRDGSIWAAKSGTPESSD